MYEINGIEVLNVEEAITTKQTAVVKKHFCMLRKISAAAPKTAIAAGEPLTITFQWQRFNLAAEAYEPDPVTEEITFQMNDQPTDTLEPVDGTDTLIFSSAEPGTYTIKTLNPGVDNAALEVTVSA